MIVTDKFAFIHLHKSGGTFISEFISRFFPGAKGIGYHYPRRALPESYRSLPVLGFVRNPWDYYVSWYSFQSQKDQPNPLFRIVSANQSLDFGPTIDNLLSLASNDQLLDAVLATLPENFAARGMNLPRSALAGIRGSGLGFYGFLYKWMYDGDGPIHIGKMESLATDMIAFLEQNKCTVTPEMRQFLLGEAPRNSSRRSDFASYYDEPLRLRVAQLDAELIARHGYRAS